MNYAMSYYFSNFA